MRHLQSWANFYFSHSPDICLSYFTHYTISLSALVTYLPSRCHTGFCFDYKTLVTCPKPYTFCTTFQKLILILPYEVINFYKDYNMMFVPKIESILQLLANARQHSILRHMTTNSICRPNPRWTSRRINKQFFTVRPSQIFYSKEQLQKETLKGNIEGCNGEKVNFWKTYDVAWPFRRQPSRCRTVLTTALCSVSSSGIRISEWCYI